MERKLIRYFEAGVLVVWYIDPATRSAEAFESPTEVIHVPPDGQLGGAGVLPGFELKLSELFERADRQSARGKKR